MLVLVGIFSVKMAFGSSKICENVCVFVCVYVWLRCVGLYCVVLGYVQGDDDD